jgi:hypothetical protein
VTGERYFKQQAEQPRREARERPCLLIDSRKQAPLTFSEAVTVEYGWRCPPRDFSLRGFTDSVAIERKSKANVWLASVTSGSGSSNK